MAVVGSGLAALTALAVARASGATAIAIDASYRDGGYLQVIEGVAPVPKAPLFLDEADARALNSLGIEVECLDVEVDVVKHGDYNSKTLGFSEVNVQRNWFTWWIESKRLCISLDLFNNLKRVFGLPKDRPIHIASNIRKIDLSKNVLALSCGSAVKYRKLVYTWPLTHLPRLVYPRDYGYKIDELVKGLGIDFVSLYMLTALLPRREAESDAIEIYVHSTKASKMHTAIVTPAQGISALYAITSYSKRYPLVAGINEKLLSELRKHRIATPKEIIGRHSLNIVFGLINKPHTSLKPLAQLLETFNVYLFGRVAQWREYSVGEMLKEVETWKAIA